MFQLSPRLSKAARSLLGWGQNDLARISGVSMSTIGAFEAKPEGGVLTTMNNRAVVQAFEIFGVDFLPESVNGVGVRRHFTASFERIAAELLDLHSSGGDLGRVDEIVVECSEDERGALARVVGDRLWTPGNKPADRRGEEIQDRLVRVGRFAL